MKQENSSNKNQGEKKPFHFKNPFKNKEFRDFTISIAIAFFVAIAFRSLILDPFHVPSGSMIPTLLPGDKMMVSKFSYGYSKYSFPIKLLSFNGRIFAKKPERGDVVVFVLPSDTSIFYVKRIVGLPGEIVEIRNNSVRVNGIDFRIKLIKTSDQLEYDKISGNSTKESFQEGQNDLELFNEINLDFKKYQVLKSKGGSVGSDAGRFIVPKDHYFVMGDNRDNSLDSRFSKVGFIPFENIIGKPKFIFFSSEKNIFLSLLRPSYIRWSRIFSNLKTKIAKNNEWMYKKKNEKSKKLPKITEDKNATKAELEKAGVKNNKQK